MPAARAFAREALADWNVTGRADDVLLCVSELATNALVHGAPPGRGFLLRLLPYDGGGLRVEVHDSGDGVPAVPRPDAGEPGEGGRGLLLVAELADKWGGWAGAAPERWCGASSRGREEGPGGGVTVGTSVCRTARASLRWPHGQSDAYLHQDRRQGHHRPR